VTLDDWGTHIVKFPEWLTGRRSANTDASARLVGSWHRVGPLGDGESAVEIQFLDGAELRYCVLANDKWQIMKLTWRVDGTSLVTNQPSAPREERTCFAFDSDGALVLEFAGERSTYHRGEPRASVV